jgi:hypothetical protein
MKSLSLVRLGALVMCIGSLFAQEVPIGGERIPTVETKWPGINFGIHRVDRIQENRLLVWVRVLASSAAPRTGTFLGTKPQIPASATKQEISAGLYNPKPFSLASSIMIDEQTQQRYPVLSPIAPPGVRYFPGELVNGLLPGQAHTLTIQFAAPPTAPPSNGHKPSQKTVSFLLPGAKGPISKVAVPRAN